ncbi:DUF6417 family protein [Streptomyces sp. NPDC001904]|uniref:DUF6417 family protein n=1 Tax=Streptomyces sp. NPDC001904 TaxID=3154531 RepID=UPI00332EC6E3
MTTGPGLDARCAGPAVKLGLLREAAADDLAELSIRAGRSVLWAVQLTSDGWDVLLYTRQRVPPVVAPPEPGLQKVALRRFDLDVLKRFVALGERLRWGPEEGLAAAVEAAQFDPPSNRWIVYVDGAQMDSMARAYFLERQGGSAAPANRFARVYGVTYAPQPLDFAPLRSGGRAD